MKIQWFLLGISVGTYAMQTTQDLVKDAVAGSKTWVESASEYQKLTLNGCLCLTYFNMRRPNLSCAVFDNLCENIGRNSDALITILDNSYIDKVKLPIVSHARIKLAHMLSRQSSQIATIEKILSKICFEHLSEMERSIAAYIKGSCLYQQYKALQRATKIDTEKVFEGEINGRKSLSDSLEKIRRLQSVKTRALNELKSAVDDENSLDITEIGLANVRIAFLLKNSTEKRARLSRALFLLLRDQECINLVMIIRMQLANMFYSGLGGQTNLGLARNLLLESRSYWEDLNETYVYFDEKSEGEHKVEACRQLAFLCGESDNPEHYVLIRPLLNKLGKHFFEESLDDFKMWAYRWLMADALGLGKLGKSTCNYAIARKELENFLELKWSKKTFQDILFAQRHLAQLYCEELGGPRELAKARPLLETIIKYSDQWIWPEACSYLEHIYEQGIGGSRDMKKAGKLACQQTVDCENVQPFIA